MCHAPSVDGAFRVVEESQLAGRQEAQVPVIGVEVDSDDSAGGQIGREPWYEPIDEFRQARIVPDDGNAVESGILFAERFDDVRNAGQIEPVLALQEFSWVADFRRYDARTAGLLMISEGLMSVVASLEPIMGASCSPRAFSGRSRSDRPASFQLDFAWRTTVRVFMALKLTSIPFAGGPPRTSCSGSRADRIRARHRHW